MKITLENFKCYTKETFDLGDKGLILISGPSGSGKSSILSGIFFCLYGEGTDLIKDGAKNCNVILEINDFIIARSKRPNKLVLSLDNIEYYEDDAQERINKVFGNVFETTGYISQDCSSSFVSMNPVDKLEFLEKFIFRELDISDKKNRCKSLIKQRNEELLICNSKLEVETRIFDEMETPQIMEFPIKCSISSRDKIIKNENVKLKNSIIRIKKTENEIEEIIKQINLVSQFQVYEKSKNDEIDKKRIKIKSLKEEQCKFDYKGDEYTENLERKLYSISTNREYISTKNQYEKNLEKLHEMKSSETKEIETKIETINNKYMNVIISDTREKILELKTIVEDVKEYKRIYNSYIKYNEIDDNTIQLNETRLNKINNKIEEVSKQINKLEIEKSSYTCPSCDKMLLFENNKLKLLEHDSDIHDKNILELNYNSAKKELSQLIIEKKSIEKYIMETNHKVKEMGDLNLKLVDIHKLYIEDYENIPIDEIYEAMNDILLETNSEMKELCETELEYINDQKNKRTLENLLTNRIFNSSIMKFEKLLGENKIQLDKLEEDLEIFDYIESNEDELNLELSEQKSIKQAMKMIELNIRTIEKEIKELLNEISARKDSIKDIRKLIDLQSELQFNKSVIEENKLIKSEKEKSIASINAFLENEKKVLKYNEWKDKIELSRKEESILKSKLASINILKDKIIEAESIALSNVINSINSHTQIYLDEFFPTIPISVRLLPFKETQKKTSKPCINMEVEYKGMSCSLSRLSGGQRSRIILAYTLALADMFNLPMIMIDECTSSLDQELNTIVMDSLKQHFENKLVLIISHQSVEGHFDNVINLKEKFD
jgi:DNA repair exonuclease SbcCD ATPase subunit